MQVVEPSTPTRPRTPARKKTLWILAPLLLGFLATIAYIELNDRRRIADVSGQPDQTGSQVKLVEVSTIHEFGDVLSGTSAAHDFEIRNVSGNDVQLLLREVSCSCTSVSLSRLHLHKGETASLKARMHFTSTNSPIVASTIKIIASGSVGGNEPARNVPAQQQVLLSLQGHLLDGFGMQPTKADFGEVRRGEGIAERTFEMVLPLSSEGVDSWETNAATKAISVMYEEQKDDRRGIVYRGSVRIDPDKAPLNSKEFQAALTFRLRQGTERVLLLPVSGRFTGPLTAEPSTLVWQGSDRNKQRIVITAPRKALFSVKTVSCDSPLIHWDMKNDSGEKVNLDISCQLPIAPSSAVRSTLRIECLDSTSKKLVLEIPVLIL